jgi:hypothetical protein
MAGFEATPESMARAKDKCCATAALDSWSTAASAKARRHVQMGEIAGTGNKTAEQLVAVTQLDAVQAARRSYR